MTTVGEPIEPDGWRWYYSGVGKSETAITKVSGANIRSHTPTVRQRSPRVHSAPGRGTRIATPSANSNPGRAAALGLRAPSLGWPLASRHERDSGDRGSNRQPGLADSTRNQCVSGVIGPQKASE